MAALLQGLRRAHHRRLRRRPRHHPRPRLRPLRQRRQQPLPPRRRCHRRPNKTTMIWPLSISIRHFNQTLHMKLPSITNFNSGLHTKMHNNSNPRMLYPWRLITAYGPKKRTKLMRPISEADGDLNATVDFIICRDHEKCTFGDMRAKATELETYVRVVECRGMSPEAVSSRVSKLRDSVNGAMARNGARYLLQKPTNEQGDVIKAIASWITNNDNPLAALWCFARTIADADLIGQLVNACKAQGMEIDDEQRQEIFYDVFTNLPPATAPLKS